MSAPAVAAEAEEPGRSQVLMQLADWLGRQAGPTQN